MKKLQLIVLFMLLFCEAGFSQADRNKVLALEASSVQSGSTNFSPNKSFEKQIKKTKTNKRIRE